MTHELPEEQDYAVAVHVAAPESMLIATPLGLSGTVTFGGAQGPATLIMTIASGRDAGEDTAAACAVALVDDARTLGADALRAAHRAWWQSFWAQSAVYYDDPALNQAWVMGLYALASSTRPHTSPPNLQGLWNQYDIPPWHTDYHFNVNMQESLWAACSANHPELQESFVRCLATDWRDEFRRFAEEQFAAPGLAIPFCTDWRGRAIGGWPLGVELCPTAWAAQHLWWQWRFTGDLALLRDTVYPFLEESCAFYRHLLVRGADGDYHIELSHSPEQVCPREGGGSQLIFGRDPAIDIALVRELFTNAATASDALGLDASVAEEYRAVAQALPPLPTHQGVLVDYATAFFPWGDAPGMFPWSHRHPSRLVPIFPCEEIGLHSPAEQLQLGRDSFHEFRSYGTMDSTGWSLVFQACIAARLGLAVEAEEALRVTCERFLLGGLLSSHNDLQGAHGPLFQIEALLGFPAAMNEMLLQAVGGVLRVFPALPAGRRAAFTQLRAPGGVLVSAAHDGTGVTALQLRCEQAQVIQLLNPYPGEMVMLRGDDGVEVVTPTPIITWSAQPGVNYHIMPAGSC
jgi:alpha-L-fucosidase 2